jgi:hypothetical protein
MNLLTTCFILFHSDFSGKDESHTEEFILDIENPERNPMDIWVSHGENIPIDDYVVDALTIYKHIADVRDAETPSFYEAKLVEDGRALLVTMPSVPNYFLKNMVQMKANEANTAIDEIFLDHSIKMTTVMANRDRQKKTVKMYFPDGITCNTEHFNNANQKSNKVNKKIRLVKLRSLSAAPGGPEIPILASYVAWTVAIDGSLRLTTTSNNNGDDPFADAIKRMKL